MFKLFGVGEDRKEEDFNNDLEIELTEEEEALEEELGQIVMDVIESPDFLYIVAPIAGVDLEDIDISLNRTILTIKGNREESKEYSFEGAEIKNSEVFYGKFVRNVILPENLELNKIKAYMENNMLVITIPKLKFDSKTITVDRFES